MKKTKNIKAAFKEAHQELMLLSTDEIIELISAERSIEVGEILDGIEIDYLNDCGDDSTRTPLTRIRSESRIYELKSKPLVEIRVLHNENNSDLVGADVWKAA